MTHAVVAIQKLTVHADARGAVFEPLEAPMLAGWRNVHTVISEPGAIRGNHRHLRGTEVTAVLGPALVRYRVGERIEDQHVPAGEAWRFAFPPGTAHAFQNTGVDPMVLVSFNTEPHDPAAADAVREQLISP
ncbi:MAG TPA: cupin domain-containing protein [Steroidobacteraceae bacterium]|jgi:dTDP-4-dehydrorhamnose 3,5-epimerase-like enzyme